jgi:hypothetical protein
MKKSSLVEAAHLRAELEIHVLKSSQRLLATELGISVQNLNGVLKGRRPPGPAICALLGYERVPSYMYRRLNTRRRKS